MSPAIYKTSLWCYHRNPNIHTSPTFFFFSHSLQPVIVEEDVSVSNSEHMAALGHLKQHRFGKVSGKNENKSLTQSQL